MNISLKCFATLEKFQPKDATSFPVQPGETVAQVIARLGIDREDVAIIFVNSVHAPDDTILANGDRLGLFPAVGGG